MLDNAELLAVGDRRRYYAEQSCPINVLPRRGMWEQFFLDFFDRSAESIGIVVHAWGCREGWLQGELYRAGCRRGLRVNEYPLGGNKKADLCCRESPRMVAEVKVLGADYQGKMRYALDSDVERLTAIQDVELEKYMVLVIPNSEMQSSLGEYLDSVCYSAHCIERGYPEFKVRLWRVHQSLALNKPL